MSAEPESGIGAGSSAAEFLTAADTESIAQHCPEILTAIHALDTANATIGNSAAVDGSASLAMGKGLELLRRKLEFAMASNTRVMVDEVDPPQYGARRLPSLLRQTMRISASEATRRLRMASWLTPRRTLSGQHVPAQLPEAGGSMAAGLLSVEQAQEVIKQIEMLPARVRSEHGPAVEKLLVDNAPDLQVTDVRALGARVRGHLDPDGRLAAEPAHPDEYFVSVKQKTNGDWRLSGLLDATTGLTLNALLTNRQQNPADIVASTPGSAAEPVSSAATTGDMGSGANAVGADGRPQVISLFKDSRPDGARRHDRFSVLISRGACQPGAAGAYALVVTATAEQFARGRGEVEAAGGHARLEDILQLSPGGKFYYLSQAPGSRDVMVRSEGRFATGTQMTLLKARDRGCSFPDCDIPVGWCEAHHIRAHRHGGPTEISNLTLLCRFHHGWHERHGWRAVLLNGLPAWIPPYTVDRERRPIYHSRYVSELTRPDALISDELLADASLADSLPPDDAVGASDRSAPGPTDADDARISGDAEVDDGAGFSDDGWFESASLLPEDALFPESRCDDPP